MYESIGFYHPEYFYSVIGLWLFLSIRIIKHNKYEMLRGKKYENKI